MSQQAARRGIAIGLAAAAVAALGATSRVLLTTPPPMSVIQSSAAYVPTSDGWFDELTNASAWRGGRFKARQRAMTGAEARDERLREESEAREARLREEREALERARELGRERGTYRTVCVRLCDGYFFPVSFATTPDRFAADEQACRSRCASSARLYVYPNPGGEPEHMTDIRGQPYSALKTAFLFRTNYVESCTCKAHPWEQEALDRHRLYAERAQKRPVTAKVRSEPHAATPGPRPTERPKDLAARSQRPEGAMLVGASESKAPPAPESSPKRDMRRGSGRHGFGDRSDWRNRAFGND